MTKTIKTESVGATKEFLERLDGLCSGNEDLREEVIGFTQEILKGLPKTKRLGSLSAGLMLAAHAYAEYGAAAARALVDETKAARARGGPSLDSRGGK